MRILLGIDVGTSGTKALACDERGRVLATADSPHPLLTPKPGWSEQRPDDWWKATVAAVKAVLRKAKIKPESVVGVGFSGQMHGSVFLDSANKVVRPALLWNDQRTAKQCDEITSLVGGRSRLVELVGNPALTGFTAPKILWLRENEPKKFERVRTIILPKDYVRFKMTGEHAIDAADASGTLLLDVRHRNWNQTVLDALHIDRAMLPKVVESSDVVGTLTKSAAKELGLRAGTPVVAGAGDQAAGAVGNGVVSSGIVNASLGTSGVIFAASDSPTFDPLGRVHTMCHAMPGKWCVFGCMLSAAGSFEWLAQELGGIVGQSNRSNIFTKLTDLAQKAPPGCEGLFFLPYLTGERCPHPDPLARGAWVGLTRRTTRAMIVRSLLEGVTFGMADMLAILRDEMKIPVTEARGTGGGIKSDFWRQLQATIYNTPLVVTNSTEGGAFGAALLAGVGANVWPDVETACRQTIKPAKTTKPNRKLIGTYAKHHAVYGKLYGDLKARFAEIAGL